MTLPTTTGCTHFLSPTSATCSTRTWSLLTTWSKATCYPCPCSTSPGLAGVLPALLPASVSLLPLPRDIEIFALFISCMCHDLDHRGTNNSFQVASVSRAQSWDGQGGREDIGTAVGVFPTMVPSFCLLYLAEISPGRALQFRGLCHGGKIPQIPHCPSLLGSGCVAASLPAPCLLSWSWFLPQRHHFAQAIAILNSQGCNIFDHFSRKVSPPP